MFLRIDRDLFVNISSIGSIKLLEDNNSYKLILTGVNGNIMHTVIYLKSDYNQMEILIGVNDYIRGNTVNPEVIVPMVPEEQIVTPEESHIEEQIADGQLSLFDEVPNE